MRKVFPLQDGSIVELEYESQADNFELELKKFFSFGRRRTGKSITLARVLVETALESGKEIKIIDHYLDAHSQHHAINNLYNQCRMVIDYYKSNGCHIMINPSRNRDTLSLYLDPCSYCIYDRLKIENNPNVFRPITYIAGFDSYEKQLNKKLLLL